MVCIICIRRTKSDMATILKKERKKDTKISVNNRRPSLLKRIIFKLHHLSRPRNERIVASFDELCPYWSAVMKLEGLKPIDLVRISDPSLCVVAEPWEHSDSYTQFFPFLYGCKECHEIGNEFETVRHRASDMSAFEPVKAKFVLHWNKIHGGGGDGNSSIFP